MMIADSTVENNIVNPRVSVLMISYNHENFIAQAIDSVLIQKTQFPLELVIGEDCSTDKTREIIEEYQQKYPEIVKLLPSDKRYGPNQNFVRVYQACRGEYIATLEGDDYWIDDGKLQMQADLLDKHPEMSACFHHVKQLTMSDNELTDFWPKEQYGDVTVIDLLNNYRFHTTALMFRKSIFNNDLPALLLNCKNLDYPLYLSLADKSTLGYIDKSMSVYRIHNSGIWTSLSLIDRNTESIHTFEQIDNALNGKYHKQIIADINKCKAVVCVENGRKFKALFYEIISLMSCNRKYLVRRNNHYKAILY
ncbi:MAG: glycosyltransferase, partial [bacterium]